MVVIPVQADGADVTVGDVMHPSPWEIRVAPGPVVVTAIHAGHDVSPAAAACMAVSEQERFREEDPLTDFWLGVGDSTVRVNRSRFEVDLNRPRSRALSQDPADTWGIRVWREPPPDHVVEASLGLHQAFYETIGTLMDQLIARWGMVLVLDVHSYNHRRDGPARTADAAHNPDIDLGVTTLDRARFGSLLERFSERLASCQVGGRSVDVQENVKYEGGGHFPEWLHARYPATACVISLEYKKVFMDEWACSADIVALNALRASLAQAVAAAREELARCR